MTPEGIREAVKWLIAFFGSGICWFLGKTDGLFYTLLALMTADYISGVGAAVAEKKLSSGVGFRGIAKKVLIVIIVGLANLLDTYVLKSADLLRIVVVFYYIANEGLSIVENAVRLGLPVPEKLKNVLVQLKNKGDEDNDSDKR